MIRNFLFRLFFIIYWVVGFPIYLVNVAFCWVFALVFVVIICCPICWLLFGQKAVEKMFDFFDFDRWRKKIGWPTQDVQITPMWFPILFEKLCDIYKYNGCKKFL